MGCSAPGACVIVSGSHIRGDGGAVSEGLSVRIGVGAALVGDVSGVPGVVLIGSGVSVEVVLVLVSLLLEVPKDVFVGAFV
eukprot:1763677-Heterocapsa_arctica.AAC.1